jgi:Zn-dependent peptidase ImmA (M78 family)
MAGKILSSKRKAEIEEQAEWAIEDRCPPAEFIDPAVIAKARGITYSLNDYNNDFKGLIECRESKFHIYLNAVKNETLKSEGVRYSFAHELGHYLIDEHRLELMNQGILPQSSTDPILSENIFEKEAEYFASCLLMPRSRINNDIKGVVFSFDLILQIRRMYHVSLTAALLRYVSIGETPIAIICSRDGKVPYPPWKHKNFPFYNLNLAENGSVPPGSKAGDYFYDGIEDFRTTKTLDASCWFRIKNESDQQRLFHEYCFLMKTVNQVTSVVWEKEE